MQLSISNNWTLPIEVPGYGIVFPQRGLESISEGAIAYLVEFGYLISEETQKPSTVFATETPEETRPKRKPKAIDTPPTPNPE